MSNKLWKLLLASPAFLGMGLTSSAIASETTGVASLEAPSAVELAQVNSVNDLSDVSPADWAYTALQNLVEQYQCIEGYPNRTFRGGQPLTRYEFAAGLNACLDNILAIVGPDGIDSTELDTIRRLQEEFAAELATLRGRVDALEAETAELREQQFSTTTKLRGQVDAHVIVPIDELDDVFEVGDEGLEDELSDDTTTFVSRARLNFDASFTGEDRLRVRLQARDGNALGAVIGGLANGGSDQEDAIELDDFFYTFPIGERVDVIIAANSVVTDDFVTSTIVPFDGPSVADAGGPLLYDFDMGGGGFGAGVSVALTDNIVIDAGYSGETGDSGTNDFNDGGIFGADEQSYIVQGNYISDGLLDVGLAYLRGNDGGDNDFTDTFAGLVNLDFGRFFIAGYGAYHDDGDDDDFSWMAGAGINDLFFEGSQLGAYYANIPSYGDFELANGIDIDAPDDPWMAEVYYELPVNQFLTITPSIIYGNLDIDSADEDENFYATIRATFRF
ncbi:MAG: iron uptake porin [Leptolyngbyaceae cyanobacterium]